MIPLAVDVMLAEFKQESFIGAAPWLLIGSRGLHGKGLLIRGDGVTGK